LLRVTKHPADDPSADLDLLRLLEQHPEYSQRQLSSALGISLGKTHYLLKALLDKGLVKAQNFRRADNKLAYLYVLTPSGARQKVQHPLVPGPQGAGVRVAARADCRVARRALDPTGRGGRAGKRHPLRPTT